MPGDHKNLHDVAYALAPYGFDYVAYGLHIHSALPLPELPVDASDAPRDVHICLNDSGNLSATLPSDEEVTWQGATEALFHYYDAGSYLVRGGTSIIVAPTAEADAATVRFYLLGVAMGLLLHQRGQLALHASAIAMGSMAIGFVGDSGQGKSTLAAHLHSRGHCMLTDDILALTIEPASTIWAHPGYPLLKLWPDTVAALGGDPTRLPEVALDYDKRAYHISAGFGQHPQHLSALYLLAYGAEPRIKRLSPAEGLLALIGNTYALRFIGSAGATTVHFRHCATVAATIPIYHLQRPAELADMEPVALLLEQHTEQIVAAGAKQ